MRPIYILYGTETYNSADLADRTAEALLAQGLQVQVEDMGEFEPADIASLHTVLIVTSTFGAGEPPFNAQDLYEHLMAECPPLPHLRFAVCGLGDSSYEEFCQCGKDFDARLEQLGARRFAARADCDVEFEAPWAAWLAQVQAALAQMSFAEVPGAAPQREPEPLSDPEPTGPVTAATMTPPPKQSKKAPALAGTRKNPFIATVIENYNLNGVGSAKETRHVALSLAGCPTTYRVGDSLGLFPRNCPDLTRRVLRAAGLAGDEAVNVRGEWLYLRDALIYRCDLNLIDNRMFQVCTGGPMARMFAPIVEDPAAKRAYMAEHHVLDLLSLARVRLEGQQLIDCLRPLQPRLYSISSSPLAHPDEVHLTVDVVRYEMHGMHRKGVSSTFLAERAGPVVQIPVYVHPSGDFGLVEDDDYPIIMIGPGTGIAPFRAFLEERQARGARGYSWLFFGSRHQATDYLYGDTIQGWIQDGTLTRLDLAFSRDQEAKIYVQDRMWENGADFYAWLEADAHVYICGDASRMAKDVHNTMVKIIMAYGGVDEPTAEARLKQMVKDKRYQRDVY